MELQQKYCLMLWTLQTDLQIFFIDFFAFADALRTELQQKLELELENIRKSHGAELRTARMELERAVEISKQKVCQLLPARPPAFPSLICFTVSSLEFCVQLLKSSLKKSSFF